jgi:hypothetical protein
MYLMRVHGHAHTFSPKEVATTPAYTGSALRSFWRQGRDSSRLTMLVGGKELRPDNQPDVNVLSCVRRASYGSGSRWNGRPGSAISLPQGLGSRREEDTPVG